MKDIEQLLSKKPAAPQLTSHMKDRLFARVLEKEAVMHTPTVRERFRSWFVFVPLSVGALGVAVIALWYMFDASSMRPTQDQIALVNASINTNATNINTRTNENVNTLVVAPEPLFAHTNSLDFYIRGGGGGGVDRAFILQAASLSTMRPTRIEQGTIPLLTSEQINAIFSVFDIASDQIHTRTTKLGETVYTTLPTTISSPLCIDARLNGELSLPCVFISPQGIIDFEQAEDRADADGLTEALQYIQELTDTDANRWEILPLAVRSYNKNITGWVQYSIVPKNEPFFTGQGFHASLSNGRLVSLLGGVSTAQKIFEDGSVVSATEALERAQQDLSLENIANMDAKRWVVDYYIERSASPATLNEKSLILDIKSVVLTSVLCAASQSSGQRGTISLHPVYKIRGTIHNTTDDVEIIVDASMEGDILGKFLRLVSHPAELISL